MQPFVTIADFNTPYQINLALVNDFELFVEKYQAKVLKQLLGIKFYKAFEQGLAEQTVEERWEKLRDGDIYKIGVHTFEWKGMKEMLIPYLWAMYQRAIYIDNIQGSSISKVENSLPANPSSLISNAYNYFSEVAGNIISGTLYAGEIEIIALEQNTLFGFLWYSENTYLDAVQPDYNSIMEYLSNNWELPGTMNSMNI
jgi:hypothetical protein